MIVGSLLLIGVAVVLLVFGLTGGSSPLLIGSIAASLLAAVALVVGARQDSARADDGIDDRAFRDDGYDDPRRGDVRGSDIRGGDVRGSDEEAELSQAYAAAAARGGRAGQRVGGFGDRPAEPTVTLPVQPTYATPPPPPESERFESERFESERFTAPPSYQQEPRQWEETGATAPAGPGETMPEAYDDEDPPDEPAPQVVSSADAARVAQLSTDVLVIDGRPRYHLPGCVHLLGRENEPLPVSEAAELGFTPCSLCEPASALLT